MKGIICFLLTLMVLIGVACEKKTDNTEFIDTSKVWRFAVVGDSHVTYNSDTVSEMIPYFLEDSIDLILLCGDIVQGGKNLNGTELEAELVMWQNIFQPLYNAGIGVYPVRGNHENDVDDNIEVWNKFFSGDKVLPQNGPSGETNLTYSFNHKNAFFVGLDTYVNIHKINQTWLDQQFAANTNPLVFVYGHEAAFKVFHSDCLDNYSSERNSFWESLSNAGVKTYFCGHDHFFDLTEIDDGDGNDQNNVYQYLVGTGGAWLMPKYNYNGDNSNYTIDPIYHKKEHGYALVEIGVNSKSQVTVIITWKERFAQDTNVSYIATSNVISY